MAATSDWNPARQPQLEGQLAFARWLEAHRLAIGIGLLTMLAIGLFGYYPLIVDEWPRLEEWQRAAIWVGDLAAVIVVIQWSLSRAKGPVELFSREEMVHVKRRLRWIVLTLLFSLAIDVAGTLYAIYTEKFASEQSTLATATVTNVTAIPWKPVMHYRLNLEFQDAGGITHNGLIVFTKKREGYPSWVEAPVRQALEQGQTGFPMAIRYDPNRHARVWGAGEHWNRGQALAYAFAMVHMFQIVIVGVFGVGILFAKDFHPTPASLAVMPMLALLVEAGVVLLFGPLYRIRGF